MQLPATLVKQRRALAKLWLRWRLPIIAGSALVALVAVASVAWRELAERSAERRQQSMTAAVQAVAGGVGGAVRAQIDALAPMLEGVDLAGLIERGDAAETVAVEASLAAERPGVLRERILPTGVRKTESVNRTTGRSPTTSTSGLASRSYLAKMTPFPRASV